MHTDIHLRRSKRKWGSVSILASASLTLSQLQIRNAQWERAFTKSFSYRKILFLQYKYII